MAQRVGGNEVLAHERAIGVEDLDSVVRAVADVHEVVVRDHRAVDRPAELRCRLAARRVLPEVEVVVRIVAVRTPVALELTGVHVEPPPRGG